MRNIACLLLVLAFTVSCSTSKLYREYKSYRRDKYFNYPEEKLTLKFNSDTTGEFINRKKNGEIVNQHFIFSRVNDDYLIIKKVDLQDIKNISFRQGDTIILAKRRLLFFYNGDKRYFLSFKKK
jgi:hypothetical protein